MKNVTYFGIGWSPYNRADINYQNSYYIDATNGLAILTVLNDADGSNAIYLQKIDYLVICWLFCFLCTFLRLASISPNFRPVIRPVNARIIPRLSSCCPVE